MASKTSGASPEPDTDSSTSVQKEESGDSKEMTTETATEEKTTNEPVNPSTGGDGDGGGDSDGNEDEAGDVEESGGGDVEGEEEAEAKAPEEGSIASSPGPVDCPPKEETEAEKAHLKDLVSHGLDVRLATRLCQLFSSGKLALNDLDERALDALKEFGHIEGVICVLNEFEESNLEHVSNKSAFLCGLMKTHRQKEKAGKVSAASSTGATHSTSPFSPSSKDQTHTASGNNQQNHPGPDEAKLKAILERTGYTLDVTSGQRKYGGPPPDWDGPAPGSGCEVFAGKIPKELFEDELVPLFEECGRIWDLRLMIDPLNGYNRGYAFVTYCNRDDAHNAQQKLDGHEIRKGKSLKVNISVPNLRLFVGNIPKSKSKDEILQEFCKLTAGLIEVIVYSSPDDRKRNRGFCFLEYDSHKSASLAKRKLSQGRTKVWGCDILVDWADPQEEPDDETMSKVKVLYVRNLVADVSEEQVKELFAKHGSIERVKKIKDYAFVHFDERNHALKAMEELNGEQVHGVCINVSLAKPPSDRKKKEEILRNRERRVNMMMQQRAVLMGVPRGPLIPAIAPPLPAPPQINPMGAARGGRNRAGPMSMGSAPAYGHRAHPLAGGGYELDYGHGYGTYGRPYDDYHPPHPAHFDYNFHSNSDGYFSHHSMYPLGPGSGPGGSAPHLRSKAAAAALSSSIRVPSRPSKQVVGYLGRLPRAPQNRPTAYRQTDRLHDTSQKGRPGGVHGTTATTVQPRTGFHGTIRGRIQGPASTGPHQGAMPSQGRFQGHPTGGGRFGSPMGPSQGHPMARNGGGSKRRVVSQRGLIPKRKPDPRGEADSKPRPGQNEEAFYKDEFHDFGQQWK